MSRLYRPIIGALLLLGVALVLCFLPRRAHAAERHHSASPAACEARQRAKAAVFGDDTLDLSSAGFSSPTGSPEYLAQREAFIAKFNPSATREFYASQAIAHYCHGASNGIGEPLDRTITITGRVFYDGSFAADVR